MRSMFIVYAVSALTLHVTSAVASPRASLRAMTAASAGGTVGFWTHRRESSIEPSAVQCLRWSVHSSPASRRRSETSVVKSQHLPEGLALRGSGSSAEVRLLNHAIIDLMQAIDLQQAINAAKVDISNNNQLNTDEERRALNRVVQAAVHVRKAGSRLGEAPNLHMETFIESVLRGECPYSILEQNYAYLSELSTMRHEPERINTERKAATGASSLV